MPLGILGRMGHTVVHVVGARPNFMKAAPVVAALRAMGVDQRLVWPAWVPEPTPRLRSGSGSPRSRKNTSDIAAS